MAGTYNQRMVSHSINNYLAKFAATISDVALAEQYGVKLFELHDNFVIYKGELLSLKDPKTPRAAHKKKPIAVYQG